MKYLVLVKHSLPAVVENVPARNWALSTMGDVLSRKISDKLRVYQPDVLFSSNELKAKQTAEIIAGQLGINFEVVDGLHEHDRSNSPYYSKDEFQRLVSEFFASPDRLIFGMETGEEALFRFRNSMDKILDAHGNKNVVTVTHGTVISLYAAWFAGVNGFDLWKSLGLPSFVVLNLESRKLLGVENLAEE